MDWIGSGKMDHVQLRSGGALNSTHSPRTSNKRSSVTHRHRSRFTSCWAGDHPPTKSRETLSTTDWVPGKSDQATQLLAYRSISVDYYTPSYAAAAHSCRVFDSWSSAVVNRIRRASVWRDCHRSAAAVSATPPPYVLG